MATKIEISYPDYYSLILQKNGKKLWQTKLSRERLQALIYC